MKYEIIGDNLQMATVYLSPDEEVYAEAGAMIHMSDNMSMNARARGGILKGLKRKVTGESFFLTEFTPTQGDGHVAFAGLVPGKILALDLDERDYIVQKDAFLAAESTVDLDVALTRKLGSGFFGGEGFILQRLSGEGLAFIHACGDILERDLQEGERIRVDTGCVVGFEEGVDYSIERAGNIKTSLFGGEGIFLTTLTGPGRVYVQSMTLNNLAAALRPYLLTEQTSGKSLGATVADGLLFD